MFHLTGRELDIGDSDSIAAKTCHMNSSSTGWRVVLALASLKFTLVIIIALALGVVAAYTSTVQAVWGLVGPLLAFALNLTAAVVTNPIFRRQTFLLIFHLALIAIVLLLAIGRLTYLKGQLELSEGEVFDGQLSQEEKGPLHPLHLDALHFSNEGFTISYNKGIRRGDTRNRVAWTGADGQVRHEIIGDQNPLILAGYRFYTSFNKGFAPAFIWQPSAGGPPMLGTVHLPAYPLHEYKQATEWVPPQSKTPLWIMLQFDEVILDPEKPSEFHLPTQYQVVVRSGDERHELKPGDSLKLPDGVLEFDGLRSWMGYTVFYDRTLPWLLASGLLAVASLALHFWKKFSSRPWNASLGE